jgi:hypothetical protein
MTNDGNAFEEFPSLCPPVVAIAAAATRHRRHRPPHVDQGFLSLSPKKVPITDTSDTVVALPVGDNRQRGGEGGRGGGGGGIFVIAAKQEAQDGGPRAWGGVVRHSKSHFFPLM